MILSNRLVLFIIAVTVYLAENNIYGWNAKPMSPMEAWWDSVVINLFVFSLTVKKVTIP